MNLFAVSLYHYDPSGRLILHAMPVMIVVLCCLAIAYRFYSKFLAAKVAALDDSRVTPAHRFHDGQNYHPTNKWVLFGHHFAAISGAGPLIGPVLAIQYGYMPGLVWLVIGVCLAGAVQDMLVLAASVRSDGKSLAEIARRELGMPAAVLASIAILFIVVIALAGLGFVVVKALGGEEVKLPAGTSIVPPRAAVPKDETSAPTRKVFQFPAGCVMTYPGVSPSERSEGFWIAVPGNAGLNTLNSIGSVAGGLATATGPNYLGLPDGTVLRPRPIVDGYRDFVVPPGSSQLVPGSSWGTFTIACTIPIALFTGLWMYRLRPGRVVEASLIGGFMTLGAVVLGAWVPGSAIEQFFSLDRNQTILALTVYGFIAAVLPVWLLLGPRDYLSSFLKIGTVGLLVVSVCIANPPLHAPMLNEVFINGGPTFAGNIFPFVFICIMCGAISGFHSLVSSGTTPKMVDKESHIRTIGYGSMLIEGLVGTVALIAAASLPSDLYYDINVPIDKAPDYVKPLKEVNERYGADRLHSANVDSPQHLDLGKVEEQVGGESLRGRTGGAVTLAVGMSVIFSDAFHAIGVTGDWLLKYWYHFAIMFEALFILTTIDAGTRIARFLLQETAGRVYKPMARNDWLPGAILASALVTAGWGVLVHGGSIATIWPMFGIANQILAVLALALVTTWLVNNGRGKYVWVTIPPLLFVCSTTMTAAVKMVSGPFAASVNRGETSGYLNMGLTIFVVSSVSVLLLWCVARWFAVLFIKSKAA